MKLNLKYITNNFIFIYYLFFLAFSNKFSYFINSQILNYNEVNWPQLCKLGQFQSPIDFTSDMTKYPLNPNFQIINSTYAIISDSIVDFYFDENKFIMKLNQAGHIKVQKKIEYIYNLTQIIFHMNSEHTFDGQNADFELQMVHEKDKDFLINNNLSDPDSFNNLLIVSTLFRATSKKNNTFIQNLNFKNQKLLAPLNITNLVYNISYFYYTGSLTTPTCDEDVDWIVNMNFEFMTPAQLMDIAYFINFIFINGNNRKIQPLNGRTVYVSSKNFNGFNQLPPPIVCSLASISGITVVTIGTGLVVNIGLLIVVIFSIIVFL